MNKINLSMDDFIEKEVFEDIIGYEINKKLKIMGKIFDKKLIEISIAIELKLVECISLINNYMQWLDNGLLNVFLEYITKDEKIKIDDNYRELIISKVIIQIDPSEDIVCIIHFEKNEYISIMEIRNKNIQFVFSVWKGKNGVEFELEERIGIKIENLDWYTSECLIKYIPENEFVNGNISIKIGMY